LSARNDAQRNDTQRNDAQRNDAKRKQSKITTFFSNSNSAKFQVPQLPYQFRRPPNFQAPSYSHLNERINILERELFKEKRLRLELEENLRKNLIPIQNQHMELVCGSNKNINDFLKRSKDQEKFPYYLTNSNGNLRCHCDGNPLAFFVDNKNYWMFAKRTSKAGKMLFIHPKCPDIILLFNVISIYNL
jgi:hypothetical protein